MPYYVTFSRYNDELRIFTLERTRYEEVKDHQGRLWIEDVDLGLGLWRGKYLRRERLWLRWYDRDGNWIPTPAEMEKEQAERERMEKEAALRKAEQFEARLRELGVDPDQM